MCVLLVIMMGVSEGAGLPWLPSKKEKQIKSDIDN
jgi:hypothetical protein